MTDTAQTPTPRTDAWEQEMYRVDCCLVTEPEFDTMLTFARQLERELAQARADIEAYRGALGYSVPGSHDGRLSDGTVPVNGIAEAMHADIEERDGRIADTDRVYKADLELIATMRKELAALRERCEGLTKLLDKASATLWRYAPDIGSPYSDLAEEIDAALAQGGEGT